jgi:hypothetical protein
LSQDFIFAVLMLMVGLAIVGVGAYSAYRQKIYYNPADNSVVTQIDVPVLGKIKTNAPAIALCFIGLVPVLFAYNVMKGRNPNLVKFHGEVVIDPSISSEINTVTVGITSGLWSETSTPNSATPVNVSISVPDTWPSYSAYAFAFGGAKTRPAIIGTNLGDPQFKLWIKP